MIIKLVDGARMSR